MQETRQQRGGAASLPGADNLRLRKLGGFGSLGLSQTFSLPRLEELAERGDLEVNLGESSPRDIVIVIIFTKNFIFLSRPSSWLVTLY
jgi:hypothetical protein